MPTPLDSGSGPRTPDDRVSRQAPPPVTALVSGLPTTGRALPSLPLRSLLLSLPAAARGPGGRTTASRAGLHPFRSPGGPVGCRRRQDRSVTGILRSVLRAARRLPRTLPLAGLLLGALLLVACTPSAHATAGVRDPLAALVAPVQSETFDLAFWVGEQAARTRLWRQAFAYCRLRPRLPNCRAVRMASWWGSPPPSASAAPATPLTPPPGPAPEGSHP